jgi:Domain of unknown function (DUF4396)
MFIKHMSEGVMLMWFVLMALSFVFVVFDIQSTPAHPVIKWAFVILTVFGGPLAAFFYVLGCREPLKGAHEAYVAAPWRQVLGSTMHCAAGDGVGIIAGAAIAATLQVSGWTDLVMEYALGFGFGWAFFQAFAMRDMAGGSYLLSLKLTFLPEFLSMNLLMAGMVAVAHMVRMWIPGGNDPALPGFWFVMSMALVAGFTLAYPMNWWLVSNGLKHGMLTVRRRPQSASTERAMGHTERRLVPAAAKGGMIALSILILGLGVAVSRIFRPS